MSILRFFAGHRIAGVPVFKESRLAPGVTPNKGQRTPAKLIQLLPFQRLGKTPQNKYLPYRRLSNDHRRASRAVSRLSGCRQLDRGRPTPCTCYRHIGAAFVCPRFRNAKAPTMMRCAKAAISPSSSRKYFKRAASAVRQRAAGAAPRLLAESHKKSTSQTGSPAPSRTIT